MKLNETFQTDAVILGSGAAGMMAGMVIAEAGFSCVILEKGKNIAASNGARAGGPALAGTECQKAEDALVTSEQLYRHMYHFARGTVNAGLLRRALDRGVRVEEIFRKNQIGMRLIPDTYGVGFRARHMFHENGIKRWQPLAKAFEEKGGKIHFHCAGEKIIFEHGRVKGVCARDMERPEVYYEYRAPEVLIATGGYLGNREMIGEHAGGVYVNPLGSRLSDGAGICMALAAGGCEDRNWGICANEFGGANQKMEKSKRTFSSNLRYAVCGGLLVNSSGRRFMNEQYLADKPLSIGGEITLREGKFYAVLDRDMYEGFQHGTEYDYYGRPERWYAGKTVHDMPSRFRAGDLERDIADGWAFQADSLDRISERFGLQSLAETVREYNAVCENGCDPLYGKETFLLRPVKSPPFYVFEYEPSAWCTFGGVKTDEFCRLLDREQKVIQGIYVAGVDNGSAFCVPYYDNEGAALGISLTTGVLAGEKIAEELWEKSRL